MVLKQSLVDCTAAVESMLIATCINDCAAYWSCMPGCSVYIISRMQVYAYTHARAHSHREGDREEGEGRERESVLTHAGFTWRNEHAVAFLCRCSYHKYTC